MDAPNLSEFLLLLDADNKIRLAALASKIQTPVQSLANEILRQALNTMVEVYFDDNQ